MKASNVHEAKELRDIPNIGIDMESTLKLIYINTPRDLKSKNPYELYIKLCKATNTRYDPCVLDTFMAAVDFVNGAVSKPWWCYTKTRKELYPNI